MGREVTANAKFDSISHLICDKPVLIEGVPGTGAPWLLRHGLDKKGPWRA